ncbi:MAG TPA: GTPase HflX, partial [Chromatiales bacterium]|nr:GTPase HflX [Chromatiales bacterium]
MFERPQRGERALILNIGIGHAPDPDVLAEFKSLACAAGADIVGSLQANLRTPNPRHLIGKGKLEELSVLAD